MTPEEWAEQAGQRWFGENVPMSRCIADAVRAAVEEEREACAREVEEAGAGDTEAGHDSQGAFLCNEIAAAIRARGK